MVLDLLSQAPYSKILRWLLLFFSWISLKLEFLNIDIPGMILVREGGRGAMALLLSEEE